jgi:hypothetical protein
LASAAIIPVVGLLGLLADPWREWFPATFLALPAIDLAGTLLVWGLIARAAREFPDEDSHVSPAADTALLFGAGADGTIIVGGLLTLVGAGPDPTAFCLIVLGFLASLIGAVAAVWALVALLVAHRRSRRGMG